MVRLVCNIAGVCDWFTLQSYIKKLFLVLPISISNSSNTTANCNLVE